MTTTHHKKPGADGNQTDKSTTAAAPPSAPSTAEVDKSAGSGADEVPRTADEAAAGPGLLWRALLLGSLFAVVFSYVTMVAVNRQTLYLPATQISCVSIVFVLLLVVGLNPLLRWLGRRLFGGQDDTPDGCDEPVETGFVQKLLTPLGRREIFLVLIMATVPAGLPVFGFVCEVLPLAGGLHHPEWNTPQSGWNKNVAPYVDNDLFVGAPLFRPRDVRDWPAFSKALIEAGEGDTPTPERHLWSRLSDDVHALLHLEAEGKRYNEEQEAEALEDARDAERARRAQTEVLTGEEEIELTERQRQSALEELARTNRWRIVDAVQAVLKSPEFYSAGAFAGVELPAEAEQLRDRLGNQDDPLAAWEVERLNRYLLEAGLAKHIAPSKFLRDQLALRQYARGLRAQDREAFPVFVKKDDEGVGEFASRFGSWLSEGTDTEGRPVSAWGAIPWRSWLTPLVTWGALGLTLCLLFYALNELVFRQWYEREKLVFPIADLAVTVLDPEEGGGSRLVPSVFRRGLFWTGFSVAFLILIYNGLVNAQFFEGLTAIDLAPRMDSRFRGTALTGLTPKFRFPLFFTIIGLAFLLPRDISFSVWFFFVLMKFQQLVAVWLGYGSSGRSFPADWITGSSFMTAQGGGAMEVFGLIMLWKVRHQIFAWVYRLARPGGVKGFPPTDVKRYTWPSALFFVGSIGLIYFIMRGGTPLGMALFSYLALLLMTIAMVRLVAECGLIGFQAWFGPIHLMKTFGLLRFGWAFAAKGLGAVVTVLASMFLDVKAFVAPTMMNARYLAERGKVRKGTFAFSLFLAIGITLVVSAVTYLALAYDQGVGSMNSWFSQGFPRGTFARIGNLVASAEDMADLDKSLPWFFGGATMCALLVYLRQFLFWMPHPIGLVMYVSPMMGAYWFSFFIAWICKGAAIKYTDADGYKAVRAFFIGLILGEVVAVALSLVLALMGYQSMGLTLNRN